MKIEAYDVEKSWYDLWGALPMNVFMQLELLSYDRENGAVVVLMPFRNELGNRLDNSSVHGGALAAMIDAAASFALCIRLGGGSMLTTNLRVDYLKRARAEPVTCRAWVVHVGKKSGLVDVTVTNAAGDLLALGRVGVSHRPKRLD